MFKDDATRFEARKTGGRLLQRPLAALASYLTRTTPWTFVDAGGTACDPISLIFPLALLAALRGGRARVHEKEEVK